MLVNLLRSLLPNRPIPVPIINGPFRGAVIRLNPRVSLRKIFGLYELELNSWLNQVIPYIDTILDVGANDGYFTFGTASALARLGKGAQIFAFEPNQFHFNDLEKTFHELNNHLVETVTFHLYNSLVGEVDTDTTVTLNTIAHQHKLNQTTMRALIKIDVEGAELEVLEGASLYINPTNYFLIEVHREEFLPKIKRDFSDHGISLVQINQASLPLLGRERRSESNWWLVSDLSTGN